MHIHDFINGYVMVEAESYELTPSNLMDSQNRRVVELKHIEHINK